MDGGVMYLGQRRLNHRNGCTIQLEYSAADAGSMRRFFTNQNPIKTGPGI